MIILGIDPGFGITGYGVIEYRANNFRMLEYGVISTKSTERFTSRLIQISDKIEELIAKYNPDAVAIEELFFNNNAKTVIAAAQGRGVAVATCAKHYIPVFEYTPLQVKQNITGYGRADKKQIQMMVKMLLKLNEIPKPDDAADALAIAMCHAHSMMFSKPI